MTLMTLNPLTCNYSFGTGRDLGEKMIRTKRVTRICGRLLLLLLLFIRYAICTHCAFDCGQIRRCIFYFWFFFFLFTIPFHLVRNDRLRLYNDPLCPKQPCFCVLPLPSPKIQRGDDVSCQ